jgi:FAS-associated factor 2
MTSKTPEEIELDRLNTTGARLGIIPLKFSLTVDASPRHPPKVTLWTLICSPFTTLHRILAFFTTFIPYISRFRVNSTPTRRQLPPQDTASRFVREFEELYGLRHIPFEQRGYADLTHHVKDNDVYLLVVLVSEEHDDTPAFCRDVLCDDQLSEWVRVNDVVVWGGNVADSEAHTGMNLIDTN